MPWLPEDVSLLGPKVDFLFYVVLVITGVAFLAVEIALLAFLFLYRRREGKGAAYSHGNRAAELIWTLVPAIILVILGFMSKRTLAEIRDPRAYAGDPLVVEVEAEQFAWNIRYPESGVTALNRLRVPLNRPVRVDLTSKDVIHSFFLPQLRVKQDAVPGMVTRAWFQAVKTGNFEIACAEFCGLAHYRMRGMLSILEPGEFQKWLDGEVAAGLPHATAPTAGAPAAPASP